MEPISTRFIPTSDSIIQETASYYSLSPEQLKIGNSKTEKEILARRVAMYIMRKLTYMCFLDIGASLGGNHATAINAVNKIEELLRTDPEVVSDIRNIDSNIRIHLG